MRYKFSGKRALLLGGSNSLALDVAINLISLDVRPTLSYRNDSGRARIDEHLQDYTGQYDTFFMDLCDLDGAVLDNFLDNGIDYLVDFAQGNLEGLVASVDSASAGKFLEVNVANRCMVIQRVARNMMARRRGRMVYISSAAVGRSNPGQGFYAAAKSALEALYRSVGLEMAGRGVTTVTLRPGYIDAGRGRRYMESRGDIELAKVPLGRALSVREVADAVVFLLSDGAVGFNATALTMDGGLGATK